MRGIDDFARSLDPSYGHFCSIDQSDLRKHGGLVPVNVFPHDLSVFELDNNDNRGFDSPAGGLYAGKHPRHLDRVSKFVNQFVDNAVFSHRA